MRRQRIVLGVVLGLLAPGTGAAQEWNSPPAMQLVLRAIGRRAAVRSDSGLRDYRARAHGFVFFLGQLGELSEPPRLIKSDQLELEVYWKAPGRSKQRIVGWRDRADLPTDIRYHRDHLGIVTNNFGDRIGLGHEEEVRNVPHPLAPDGPRLYDYALVDSLTVRLAQRAVRVYLVRARPKDLDAARVVGTMYIDVDAAELVQFRFNFTRRAYVDDTLEDITIVLENGLWDGRFWLPRRQEIEIRRRTSWLDLPARGIIRGRWEIDGYEFNVDVEDAALRGPEIVAAPPAVRDTFRWEVPLEAAIRDVTDPALVVDLEAVRGEVKRLADDRVLSGLATAKPGAASVSDLLHFNRVEGLAPGFGAVLRPGGGAVELRLWGSYGISDERLKGRLQVRRRFGRVSVDLEAARSVRDVGDEPVIAPAVNSILAQELAHDYGDYYLRDVVSARLGLDAGARSVLELTVGIERTASMAIAAGAATGTFRENPALGAGRLWVASLGWERRTSQLALGRGVSAALEAEAGFGDDVRYLRLRGEGRAQFPVGATDVRIGGWVGWGSTELPLHRGFVMGGRGTLPDQPFRAWGGRHMARSWLEWRLPVPVPALPLGTFASTGDRIVVAPFVALGVVGGAQPAVPWVGTNGVQPSVGLGVEWFHGLFRTDVSTNLRTGGVGVVADVSRGLWGVL